MKIMSEEGPVVLLFSGGKDSNYAYYRLLEAGLDVRCLVSVIAEDKHSMLLHPSTTPYTILQAEAIGVPILVGYSRPKEEKRVLLRLLKRARENFGVRVLATGGILSEYQRREFGDLASKAGLKPMSPIWGVNQEEYLLGIARSGIKALIVRVAALGLGPELLGKIIDEKLAEEIIRRSRRYGFNASFEGGEAETFVIDAPFYSKRIKVKSCRKRWFGDWGEMEITDAMLEEKDHPGSAGGVQAC